MFLPVSMPTCVCVSAREEQWIFPVIVARKMQSKSTCSIIAKNI